MTSVLTLLKDAFSQEYGVAESLHTLRLACALACALLDLVHLVSNYMLFVMGNGLDLLVAIVRIEATDGHGGVMGRCLCVLLENYGY